MLDRILGSDDKYQFSDKVQIIMRNPGGGREKFHVDNTHDFEHDGGVYMMKPPLVNPDTGKRQLIYDKGNPIPRFYKPKGKEKEDPSISLMDEQYRSSMIGKLSEVPRGSDMDLIGKLQQIPPWLFVAVLALLVLLQQGVLGDIIPFI